MGQLGTDKVFWSAGEYLKTLGQLWADTDFGSAGNKSKDLWNSLGTVKDFGCFPGNVESISDVYVGIWAALVHLGVPRMIYIAMGLYKLFL